MIKYPLAYIKKIAKLDISKKYFFIISFTVYRSVVISFRKKKKKKV